MKNIKRGELYYANLSPVVGSEQGGVHPVIILQNSYLSHTIEIALGTEIPVWVYTNCEEAELFCNGICFLQVKKDLQQ